MHLIGLQMFGFCFTSYWWFSCFVSPPFLMSRSRFILQHSKECVSFMWSQAAHVPTGLWCPCQNCDTSPLPGVPFHWVIGWKWNSAERKVWKWSSQCYYETSLCIHAPERCLFFQEGLMAHEKSGIISMMWSNQLLCYCFKSFLPIQHSNWGF